MIGPEFALLLGRHGTLLPEEFHGLIISGIGTLAEHNPRQFSIMKAAIERFEAVDLFPDIVGDRARTSSLYHLDIAWEESHHPLLAEAPVQRSGPYRDA